MLKKLFIFIFVATFLNANEPDNVIDLSPYEKSFYSQNGEDGVLAKIFDLISPSSKFCVEFGAHDGVTGSNTYLLRMQNWDCVLLDRNFDIPNDNLYKEFITADNINDLFHKYLVPFEFELLSIDIDYNDFYIWNALDERYKPSVVIIEYNATHLPHEDKVVKYRPYYCGDRTNYYGASILALYHLGRSKGYSLVYAEKNGVNLFFILDEVLEKNHLVFKNMNDVEKMYIFPTYGQGPNGGHPEDKRQREYISSDKIIK